METLRAQLWAYVCEERSKGNKLHTGVGVSIRAVRNWFSSGQQPTIRPRVGSQLWLLEKDIILSALSEGDREWAAVRLGISSRFIRNKVNKYRELGFL